MSLTLQTYQHGVPFYLFDNTADIIIFFPPESSNANTAHQK